MMNRSIYILIFSVLLGCKNPSQIPELLTKGNEFYHNKQFQEAESFYKKTIEIDSINGFGLNNRGASLYQLKDYKTSIGQFEMAVKCIDNLQLKGKTYHNLGNTYFHLQDYKAAMNAYKMSLKYRPTDQNTRYNLLLTKKKIEKKEQQDNKKDKEKQKVKDKKEDQDKKKENEAPKDDKANKDNDKNKNEEKKNPQPSPQQMSKQEQQQLMQALKNEEQKVQGKLLKGSKVPPNSQNGKDW